MNRRGFLQTTLLTTAAAFMRPNSSLLAADTTSLADLRTAADKLRPLHEKKKPNQPGDWLLDHPEQGQSFDQYLKRKQRVRDRFSTMYVQPLGKFAGKQQATLTATTECLGHFFGMPVKTLPTVSLDSLPEKARRIHPRWDIPQVLSTHLLDQVLGPRRPADAVAVLGLTTEDLWPGDGWNFVFGQASLTERVGVWSLHRNGDPEQSEAEFKRYLLRSLKTAMHETGHMLGIPHCIAYECGMNGSNNRDESDRHPLEFCPECQPKIWWTCQVQPRTRTAALLRFAEQYGLAAEAAFWKRSGDALRM